tara:strand:- start:23124 stop:23564 length:441 start_codon:yes stop_codon:yes gene_type:complete
MKLKTAKKVFDNLVSDTIKNSENKVYQDFILILTSLEKRDLSEKEMQSIELELDRLKLEEPTKNNRRYYKKSLNQFKEFLRTKFSLTSKRHYTSIGMSLGMCFGVVFGSLIERTKGISMGLSFGMLIGLLIGVYMDNQAASQGRVI